MVSRKRYEYFAFLTIIFNVFGFLIVLFNKIQRGLTDLYKFLSANRTFLSHRNTGQIESMTEYLTIEGL